MKYTADNITDEQIEALKFNANLRDDHALVHDCRVALDAPLGSLRRVTARARIADVLNARAAMEPDVFDATVPFGSTVRWRR